MAHYRMGDKMYTGRVTPEYQEYKKNQRAERAKKAVEEAQRKAARVRSLVSAKNTATKRTTGAKGNTRDRTARRK